MREVTAVAERWLAASSAGALATVVATKRSAPLPPPPSRLLDGNGRLELMEGWLFNDDGHFQLQSTASAQAQSID